MAGEFNINLSDGTVLAALYPLEVNGPDNRSTPRLIQDIQTSPDAFVLNGDLTYRFVAGFQFDVQQSAGGSNDDIYTVDAGGSSYDSGSNTTTIPVTQSIPSTSIPYGEIIYTINDGRTSLKLPGKGTINYGESLIEDLVRLTENFASSNAPESNSTITGSGPAAQPLVGQLWYDTNTSQLKIWDSSNWIGAGSTGSGSLIFDDVENEDTSPAEIYITGSESNLPSPWPGNAADEQSGLVVWTSTDPDNNEPIFRVLSSGANEHLRVEYHATEGSGYVRTRNKVDAQGIEINPNSSINALAVLNGQSTQQSILRFDTQGTQRGEIVIDDNDSGTPLKINSTSSNNVELVEGGGTVQSFGRVGINNAPPTGNVWLEVTGDIQANSQFRGSDQSAANPTYSFTNDTDTGMYLSSTGILSFAASGNQVLQVDGSTQTVKTVGNAPSADNDVSDKKYVDDTVGAISWREPVRVRDQQQHADQSAFPTTGTIDGVSLNDGDRVLFSEVGTTTDRDIWVWDASNTHWIQDFPSAQTRTVGDVTYVQQGSDAGIAYVLNSSDSWETLVPRTVAANVIYETQTASSNGQQVFTLNNQYIQGGNGLLVFVNGQKTTLGQFYNETGDKEITVIAPSDVESGDRFDFYIIENVTEKAATFQRETQTGLTGTPTITLSNITYVVGSENLLVFINGQKAIRGTNYNEVSSTEIDWLTPSLTSGDELEIYSSVPIVSGTKLKDISDVQNTPLPTDNQFLQFNASSGTWQYVDSTSTFVLDLGDDGSNQSTALSEIAIVNDSNNIFTEPSADKLLIDVNTNWPQSDDTLAIGSNSVATGTSPNDGDVLTWNNTNSEWEPQASSSGGVSSSTGTPTDNAIVRYDGTGGSTIQQTGIVVDDNDNISGHGQTIDFRTSDFTLAANDAGKVLDCDKSSAFTVTVPENASVPLPVGYTVSIVQTGSGTVSVSPSGAATIQTISTTDLNGQWAAATLYKRQTDEWVLIGDLA